MNESVLKQYIVQSLEEEKIKKILYINIGGKSGKTDGYLADIIFVTVKFINNGEVEKEVHLAVKTGKSDAVIREKGFDSLYKQELTFYSKILPALQTFELQKHLNVFDGIPKCYKTFFSKDIEVIVMENLKQRGCVMHDMKLPLNYAHLKLLLQEFGKFHAISFAYYDQQRVEFEKLVSNLKPLHLDLLNDTDYLYIFEVTLKNVLKILQDRKEPDLYEKFCKYLGNSLFEDVKKLIRAKTSYQVISHRDSWNNNVMFLYGNNSEPSKAFILDWQMVVTTNSPVYDLSFLIYTCSSVENLDNLEDLLRIYYQTFSQHVKELGSDPEELFSFATLKDHWRKFSKCVFVFVPYVIKQCYWKAEDVPSLETSLKDWCQAVDNIIIEDENYYIRLIGIIKQFLNYKLI